MHETFLSLLRDPAHWEFELFLMVVFDGLIGAVLWPWLRKHWVHHTDRDKREAEAIDWSAKGYVEVEPGQWAPRCRCKVCNPRRRSCVDNLLTLKGVR
jgi:hypothetical protein